MTDHTLRAFDVDIDGMRSAVITMGGLVEKQFTRSVDAVRYADLRLVSQVLSDEAIVNDLHVQSDLLCNQILARRQPFAVDLREVLAAIHTVNDLERVGDEAKKIALKARDMHDAALRFGLPLERVHEMAETVRQMLAEAIDAFVRQDTSVADRLVARDREVDAARDALHRELMQRMAAQAETVSVALELVFVVQSIERIGDHAKNIAEYVLNVVEGIDVRHGRGRGAEPPGAHGAPATVR
jgi:phosphate transport system protein